MIYLDNAASSWPKPAGVTEAMVRVMNECGANPGRGSHQMAVQASRILFETRRKAARLFGVHNPNDISFTLNTTMALNIAIQGFVREGDHVLCTGIEHNSVRRPLEMLKRNRRVQITYVQTDSTGQIRLEDVEKVIQKNTTLIVCSHSSNLLGTILPVDKIAAIAKKHGIRLLVDAAQTAGCCSIDVEGMGIDMLAFPGHKALLGPQGTGGLYIHPDIELNPLLYGGTGGDSENIDQPHIRPDRLEAGTQNTPGIAGLGAGIDYVLQETVDKIYEKEWMLTQFLMDGLQGINGIQIIGPKMGEAKTGIVTFRMHGASSSEIAFMLDRNYQIAVRSGFHCTPLAHEAAGTKDTGAVRASFGCFNTKEDAQALVDAMKEIRHHFVK
ncbi:aminotransferase class V-fold PLP-dependent enzyme [Marinicrinis lubricantis]|uniref:cysteine desulfurase n=1 Tax=Marinicrinis lubricantis TaxID=2086470 RepID=A0ABW1IIL7_9BACL